MAKRVSKSTKQAETKDAKPPAVARTAAKARKRAAPAAPVDPVVPAHEPPSSSRQPALWRPVVSRSLLDKAFPLQIRREKINDAVWENFHQACWADEADGQQPYPALCRGEPVSHPFFSNLEPIRNFFEGAEELAEEMAKHWNISRSHLNSNLIQLGAKLDRMSTWHKGYAGFLVTHRPFRQEQADLMARHPQAWPVFAPKVSAQTVADPSVDIQPSGQSSRTNDPLTRRKLKKFQGDFIAFCLRWRLAGWCGPDLPMPASVMFGTTLNPQHTPKPLWPMYRAINVPNWLPINQDSLMSMEKTCRNASIEDNDGADLSRWFDAVGKPGKKAVDSYATRFDVFRDWKTLHHELPEACQRRKGTLVEALAKACHQGEKTINRCLTNIESELGSDWLQQA